MALRLTLAGALYVSAPALGNPAEGGCTAAKAIAARIAPLATGEIAALRIAETPVALPDLAFLAADGSARSLKDLRGKTVLLNLWATWCVPCRQEMPALDRLQAKLGGPAFEVVAVNIDTRNPDRPRQFLAETGIRTLALYVDPSARIYQELKGIGKAFGMPTTLLVDAEGCELASLAGPADWSGSDAEALIAAALAR